MIRRLSCAVALSLLLGVGHLAAWEPGEALPDPVQEARARSITGELRCMVCQNQSIDDSDADLARDLRHIVRERILAGDSDAQVINFVVSRYGEFALLRPRFSARNALLWATPVLLLLAGGGFLLMRRRAGTAVSSLTVEEQARLDRIMRDGR